MNKITTRQDCAQLKAKGSAQVQKIRNYQLVSQEKKAITPLKCHSSLHFLPTPRSKQIPHFGRKLRAKASCTDKPHDSICINSAFCELSITLWKNLTECSRVRRRVLQRLLHTASHSLAGPHTSDSSIPWDLCLPGELPVSPPG